jgi:hypothetical protein
MNRNISLLTMGAGNVLVLKETLKSFKNICNEIIYGDMLLWEGDREILKSYQSDYNLKIVEFTFNYIFKNGFSSLLNQLSSHASNDMVMYMNTSEVIDEDYGITKIINENPDCNSFYFTHRQENHRWFRTYNRHELKWGGRIHEQLSGDFRPYHKPIFMMKDLEKDLGDPLKAKILNCAKETVYWEQYTSIVDHPEMLEDTDPGWVSFCKSNYESMKERLKNKGARYKAFVDGDLKAYMHDVMTNPEFEKERFESNNLIAFQGDKIHLL